MYHDLGNLNFTIIVSKTNNMSDFDFSRFNKPVVRALAKLGVHAEISGRNDITIDGRKFSGNAQYMKQGRIMDHGAILYDANLSILSQALKVSKDKIESKGIKSVRARVTNVLDCMPTKVPLETFKKVLLEEMAGQETITRHELTEAEIAAVTKLEKERYDTWEWNYGYSPKYDIEKERYIPGCGKFQIHLNVKDGRIVDFDIFGDYFGNKEKDELKPILIGVKINREDLNRVLAPVDIDQFFHNLPKETFIDMLVK